MKAAVCCKRWMKLIYYIENMSMNLYSDKGVFQCRDCGEIKIKYLEEEE